jgi:hypothetical protein
VAPGALGYALAPFMFLLRLQMAALGLVFHWLEMRKKVTDRGYPKNYLAILSKPTVQRNQNFLSYPVSP